VPSGSAKACDSNTRSGLCLMRPNAQAKRRRRHRRRIVASGPASAEHLVSAMASDENLGLFVHGVNGRSDQSLVKFQDLHL